MVNAIGMEVICEGVETLPQAQEFQRLGCYLAQGFYHYRPMPAGAFVHLMRNRVHTVNSQDSFTLKR